MFRSFILFAGLVLALGLAGCPQQAEEPAEDVEMVEEEVIVEEAPADASDEMPADSGDGEVNSGEVNNGKTDDSGDDGSKQFYPSTLLGK